MRRILLAPLALAALLSADTVEAQTVKIGYINSAEIVQGAPGSAEAQAQFDSELEAAQVEIQRLEAELENMNQQLQQQQLTLSPEAKANREQQLQVKMTEYQQRTGQLEQQAGQRRAELVQPIMEGYGIDMIWFGVMMVIVLEMGLISPPVGINVFVVKGIAPDVPMNDIFRGIWPFWFAMLLAILILIAVPEIALFLPNTMFG